jgi:hypothetical protein
MKPESPTMVHQVESMVANKRTFAVLYRPNFGAVIRENA